MDFNQIQTPEKLYQFMKEYIHYGFVSNFDGNIYTHQNLQDDCLYEQILYEQYFLQTPSDLLKSKYGLCFDQVELERYWFLKHNYTVFTYYIRFHNHCFLIYKKENQYYLFERTYKPLIGIHSFSSLEEAIRFCIVTESINSNIPMKNLEIYFYDEVIFGSSFYDFCSYVIKEGGRKLSLS